MRVCMLVRNRCTHDARVLKEAKTLSHQGFDVTIIAVNPRRDLPEREERDGFTIIRVEVNPLSVRVVRRLARHLIHSQDDASSLLATATAHHSIRGQGSTRLPPAVLVGLSRSKGGVSTAACCCKTSVDRLGSEGGNALP